LALRSNASAVRKIGTFAVSVGFATVLGVVSIPTLVGAIGPEAWASIALAQSVSQLFGILVAYGWGATGPSTIASLPAAARPYAFRQSLISRSYLLVVAFVGETIALTLLTRGQLSLAALAALCYLLPFAGASWYFVGEGRPGRMFLCDSLPSMLGAVAGLIGAALTHQTLVFLGFQAAGNLLSVVIDAAVVLRGMPRLRAADLSLRAAIAALRGQTHAVTSAILSGLYMNMPVVAVQTLDPALLPVYAMADRFFRYASVAYSPIQQYLQGWVPNRDPGEQRRRIRFAVFAAFGFGAAGGTAVAVLSPVLSGVLSHGKIIVPLSYSVALGIAFVGVALSAVVGYACLVVLDRHPVLAASTFVGAIVGIPLMILFAALRLPAGVASAVAASELIVAGYQLVALRNTLRRRESDSSRSASGKQQVQMATQIDKERLAEEERHADE
jgi:hypothetical protein